MAITSYGYAGSITPNNVWAIMQWGLGTRYWVYDNNNCVVSPKSDGTRQVNVGTGYMGGWGVVDNITATEVVTLPTVASGTRYYMIVARRTWGTSQTTTLTYIDAGTAVPTTLPTRNTTATTAGGIDDQPLAMVSLTAGQTVPAVFADLRVIGTADRGIMLANSELVLPYVAFDGQVVRIGNTTWTRLVGSSGTRVWEADPTVNISGPGQGNPLSIANGSGWVTIADFNCVGNKSGNTIGLYLLARRSGATLTFSPDWGALDDTTVVTIGNPIFQPPRTVPFIFEYFTTNRGTYTGGGYLNPSGSVIITDGKPGSNIGQTAGDGGSGSSVSFRCNITWNREA